MIYFLSQIVFGVLLKVIARFEIIGRDNFPKKGPFIVASNHTSFADPVILGVACNTLPIAFMAKRELFARPFLGAWLRAVKCIPVDRSSGGVGALKKAVNRLRGGAAIGIFPEGTRSTDGNFKKAEPGIGLIALKTKASIVPVYISGSDKVLPVNSKMVKMHKITAKIGKPIDINTIETTSDRKMAYDLVGEKVMEQIANLKNG